MNRTPRKLAWVAFGLVIAIIAALGLVREWRIARVAALDCTIHWRGKQIVLPAADARMAHELLGTVIAHRESLAEPWPGGEPKGVLLFHEPGSNECRYQVVLHGDSVGLCDGERRVGAARSTYLEFKAWRTLEYYLGGRSWWDYIPY